jgi:hypothetical protein
MKKSTFPPFFRHWCGVVFVLLTFCSYTFSAPVDLANEPLGTEALVPPNIWLTVDDSSSMLRTYTPDNIVNTIESGRITIKGIDRACWTSKTTIAQCPIYDDTYKYDGEGTTPRTTPQVNQTTGVPTNEYIKQSFFKDGHPPMLAAAFNGLAYDPLQDYEPPFGESDITNWEAVRWNTNWKGRPALYNLKTLQYTYSQTQYAILQERYMKGADQSVWDLFETATPKRTLGPHYYKTNVMWCKNFRSRGDANPNDCQEDRDSTYQYPYYSATPMKINASGGIVSTDGNNIDNIDHPAFELMVLDFNNNMVNNSIGNVVHRYYDENTATMASKTRTVKEELQNYANWLAYYHNRLAAAKTVISHAFADIDVSGDSVIPRVGLSSINRLDGYSSAMRTLDVDYFRDISSESITSSHRSDFFEKLYEFPFTWGGNAVKKSGSRSWKNIRKGRWPHYSLLPKKLSHSFYGWNVEWQQWKY